MSKLAHLVVAMLFVLLMLGVSVGGMYSVYLGASAPSVPDDDDSSASKVHTRRQYEPEPEQLAFFKHGRGVAQSYSRVERTEEELLPGAEVDGAQAEWYADGPDGGRRPPRVDDLI
jgi:hypothetical protein